MTTSDASFAGRHIGPGEDEQAKMLAVLGYGSLPELIRAAIPAGIRADRPLHLPAASSEHDVTGELRAIAEGNQVRTSMIGLGYHDTITPAVIRRGVLENPAWYTAYTPYQPEISQGRLEALLNFQTVIEDLTALPVAGASLLDEATAAAEAMALARRSVRTGTSFLVDAEVLPQTIAVVRTRARALGIDVVVADMSEGLPDGEFFGVLLQYPGASGVVRKDAALIEAIHSRGGLAVVAADLLALTLLRAPGEMGADVAVGSAQRFGVPMGFGGPHAGYLAVREKLARSMPGRLVGVSRDASGQPAYRLALQTREQHIRREKATSNICTAQVLLAVLASMYAVYHGPDGLREIARRVHRHAVKLAALLRALDVEVVHEAFFDTVQARVPGRAAEVVRILDERGVNVRLVDADHIGITCDELTTDEHVGIVVGAFAAGRQGDVGITYPKTVIPAQLRRESGFLTHPVFHQHHSETAMLRYLRRLGDKDYALDRGMIPLGSCTMKLNATTEMEPISWPEFARIHPFAPAAQTAGYRRIITDLQDWLAEITGYAAVSLQPNAGSQGEFAGLLAIGGYHAARGESHRTVCLIPSSAHGTNAASAVMAGMRVVVVACDTQGNVQVEDLKTKITQHRDELAAIMLTYPSTHGVFEESISELCALVHEAGGQVYVDGANLNALVGLARPGEFGADVSHLNLHKTFCIPHGGGGPGVGPIGVREHLAPYLPGHPLAPDAGPDTGPGPVSAAPWGSAGILPISWTYLQLMGGNGLTRATEVAVLSANYLASRLAPHYPVLYTGRHALVAHECIIDLRPLTAATGITVEDVAKRLIDYGFHAPTMSFPVAGTLMIEPTESENLAELDRFVEAMMRVRGEIEKVATGEYDRADNPLKGAPHPAAVLVEEWERGYSRAEAVFPLTRLRQEKYWPPVGRIDGAYGDRNLVCSCPPISAYDA